MANPKRELIGAVASFAGQVLATGIALVIARAMGGGPNADLDVGERSAVLFFSGVGYVVAQVVLLVACAVLATRLEGPAWASVAVGWTLGLAAGLFYLCGGFGM